MVGRRIGDGPAAAPDDAITAPPVRARRRSRRVPDGKTALTLVEEAVHLLRTDGSRALALYYIGACPFVAAALYFWADMTHSAFAEHHCVQAALGLSLLFLWMKAWQAIYCQRLRESLQGEEPEAWSLRRVARVVGLQVIVQPFGLFLLPLAMAAVLPFCPAYAFFQSVSVVDPGETLVVRQSAGDAWAAARHRPVQNVIIVWLLSPALVVAAAALFLAVVPVAADLAPEWTLPFLYLFAGMFALALVPLCPLGMAVAVNLGVLLIAIPELARMLLGLDLSIVQIQAGMVNTTFFAVVCGLTYLCLDPVVKAVYVLRHFYGRSRATGVDLLQALRQCRTRNGLAGIGRVAPLIFLAACLAAPGAGAAEEAAADHVFVPAEDLDQAIQDTVEQPEYAWRLPRVERLESEDFVLGSFAEAAAEWLYGMARKVRRVWERFTDWLDGLFPDRPESQTGAWQGWPAMPRAVMIALLATFCIVLGYWGFRTLRDRQPAVQAEPDTTPAVVDLSDEGTSPDELPEDGWLQLAQEMIDRGEWRLALRALFLAGLVFLDRHELIGIARHKSNRDYQQELARRSHELGRVPPLFAENVALFERVWYGTHPIDSHSLGLFRMNQSAIRTRVEPQ